MKFTNTAVKISFDQKDVCEALADLVDLNYHRPDLAKYIRKNKFKIVSSAKGKFIINIKAS
jgi:hypothetical protein